MKKSDSIIKKKKDVEKDYEQEVKGEVPFPTISSILLELILSYTSGYFVLIFFQLCLPFVLPILFLFQIFESQYSAKWQRRMHIKKKRKENLPPCNSKRSECGKLIMFILFFHRRKLSGKSLFNSEDIMFKV